MSTAGPSRLPLRHEIESTYEHDLLSLLDHLSLEERDEIDTALTSRASAGAQLSDFEVALQDLIRQARALEMFDRDRMLAVRIAAGEDLSDVDVDQEGTRRGKRTWPKRGKKKAKQLGEAESEAPPVVVPRPSNERRDTKGKGKGKELPEDNKQTMESGGQSYEPSSTSSNNTVINIPKMNRPTGHDCVICLDPIYGAEVQAPCNHYYDIHCVTNLFESATRDETLFPPRCCKQNIPLFRVKHYFSHTLIATFMEKQKEFRTLKRVYCSSPTCSRFLGPLSEGEYAGKVYTCPASGCGRQTCGKCREQYSGDWGHICRPDADATEILELSRSSGWARCPGCSQMIELDVGCFHMTCRCRTEFCYLCRAPWKTCPCRQWDEWRLFAAAEQRVDAQLRVDQRRAVHPVFDWAAPPAPLRLLVPNVQPQVVPERVLRPAPVVPRRLHELPPPVFVPARHPHMTVDKQLENVARGRPAYTAEPPITRARRRPAASRSNRRPVNNAPTSERITPAEPTPPTRPVASSSHGRASHVVPTLGDHILGESTSPVHYEVRPPARQPDNIAPMPETLAPVESAPQPPARLSTRRSVNIAHTAETLAPIESAPQPLVHLPTRRPDNVAHAPVTLILIEPALQPLVHLPIRQPDIITQQALAPIESDLKSLVRLPARRPENVAQTSETLVPTESALQPLVRLPTRRPEDATRTPEALVPMESALRPLACLPASRTNQRLETIPEHVVPDEHVPSDARPVVRLPKTTGYNRRSSNLESSAHPTFVTQETVDATEPATQPIVRLPRASHSKERPADTRSTPNDPSTSGRRTSHADMRERMIHDMMERLRVDHDCGHLEWRYRSGGGRCENCSNYMHSYLFSCKGCDMLACNRCRRNRL